MKSNFNERLRETLEYVCRTFAKKFKASSIVSYEELVSECNLKVSSIRINEEAPISYYRVTFERVCWDFIRKTVKYKETFPAVTELGMSTAIGDDAILEIRDVKADDPMTPLIIQQISELIQEKDRLVFTKLLEQASNQEIADEIGVGILAAKSQIHRTRKIIRELPLVQELYGEYIKRN